MLLRHLAPLGAPLCENPSVASNKFSSTAHSLSSLSKCLASWLWMLQVGLSTWPWGNCLCHREEVSTKFSLHSINQPLYVPSCEPCSEARAFPLVASHWPLRPGQQCSSYSLWLSSLKFSFPLSSQFLIILSPCGSQQSLKLVYALNILFMVLRSTASQGWASCSWVLDPSSAACQGMQAFQVASYWQCHMPTKLSLFT